MLMKYLISIHFLIICLAASAQVRYNYVLCSEVNIYRNNSARNITLCSLKEKSLIDAFGNPDTTLTIEEPLEYKILSYGDCIFQYNVGSDQLNNLLISKNTIRIVIQDSLELRIGSSVEKVLRHYPVSSANQLDSENGFKDLILYFINEKAQLSDLEMCTTRLIITYNPWTMIINKIHQYEID